MWSIWNCGGSAAVILPPLLHGSAAGGTLRNEWRRIEDKLQNVSIESRTVVINLDTAEVHANRVFPMAYVAWVCVGDHTLPNKGTAHRALRGRDADPPPQQVNAFLSWNIFPFSFDKPHIYNNSSRIQPTKIGLILCFVWPNRKRFCSSDLWVRQALMPGKYPPALQERDFIVPGEGYISHDGRRNLTDLQETSQWLGGHAVAKAIIAGLLGYLGPDYVDIFPHQ